MKYASLPTVVIPPDISSTIDFAFVYRGKVAVVLAFLSTMEGMRGTPPLPALADSPNPVRCGRMLTRPIDATLCQRDVVRI